MKGEEVIYFGVVFVMKKLSIVIVRFLGYGIIEGDYIINFLGVYEL